MNPITLTATVNTVTDNGKADVVNLTGTVNGTTTTPAPNNVMNIGINDAFARGQIKAGKKYLVTITDAPAD